MSTGLFVLGSCVTRDIWSIEDVPFQLRGYVARTSLASAFNAVMAPKGVIEQATRLSSRFQRRMVQADLTKGVPELLASAEYDYLILDFVDERFDLVRFGRSRGGLYTLSAELRKTLRSSDATRVSRYSAEYASAWHSGLLKLVEQVGASRIILNKVYWADRSSDGNQLSDEWNVEMENLHLRQLYEKVDMIGGIRSIEYQQPFRADPAHRWGLAPFHYDNTIYREAVERIGELTRTEISWSRCDQSR